MGIHPKYAKISDRSDIRLVMKTIINRQSGVFHTKDINRLTGIRSLKLLPWLFLLEECGALEESNWTMRRNGKGKKNILFRRLFTEDEIDYYLGKLNWIEWKMSNLYRKRRRK